MQLCMPGQHYAACSCAHVCSYLRQVKEGLIVDGVVVGGDTSLQTPHVRGEALNYCDAS